ncbi:Uncharacterised protein [Collinsella intestinalis]|nr:Uncharacterised protein [Collinsella intestinalis]
MASDVRPAMSIMKPSRNTMVQMFWVKLTTGTRAWRTFIMK